MGRHKKNKTVQQEEKGEAPMTTTDVLEATLSELDLARLELSQIKKELEEKKIEEKRLSESIEENKAIKKMREVTTDEQELMDKHSRLSDSRKGLINELERMKERDSEIITGRFINRRAPGQPAKLTYQKHAHDPVKWWPLEDGKIYSIPRGFADQINEYYHTPVFVQKQGMMDPNKPESAIHEVDTSNKKYAFVPVNF